MFPSERMWRMKTRRKVFLLIIGLIIFWLPIVLGACSTFLPASGSGLDVESQVGTQAAATLVGYLVQTKVAANLISEQATQQFAAQQVPTATPLPTDTPLPLPTATPLPPTAPPPPAPTEAPAAPAAPAAVSAPAPQISANVNTNCRQGPSTHYKIDGYLLVGATTTVYGYDPNGWWYIQSPTKTDLYCWVWGGSTTVTGDTSALNVVTASVYAEKTSGSYYTGSYYNSYGYGYGYNNNGYNNNTCQPVFIGDKVYCIPYPSYCDPMDEECIFWTGNNNCYWQNNCNNWQNNCNYWQNNQCGNNWTNNCGKKNNCNKNTYWSYCLKHPKCCGWQ